VSTFHGKSMMRKCPGGPAARRHDYLALQSVGKQPARITLL